MYRFIPLLIFIGAIILSFQNRQMESTIMNMTGFICILLVHIIDTMTKNSS